MKWIKFTPECEMPPLELNSPATVDVWICTDNPYAGRYGIGHFDYEQPGWFYQGCLAGFAVMHWAAIEPPEKEEVVQATIGESVSWHVGADKDGNAVRIYDEDEDSVKKFYEKWGNNA